MANELDAIIGVETKDEPKTFKASSGIEFKIKPISQHAITKLHSTQNTPPVPTYKTKLAGGEFEDTEYDLEYAKSHLDDPEIQKTWSTYVEMANEDTRLFNDRFGRMIILMGTEIDVPGEDSDWQKEQEFIGFAPPIEAIERKIFYMMQSVLTDDDDSQRLAVAVLALGRVDMEKVRLVRDSFRNEEGKENTEGHAEETGPVESESEL